MQIVARRSTLAVLVILCGAVPAAAQMQMSVSNACPVATVRATADGAWSDPTTWTPARVPTATDSVQINGGHTVTGAGDVDCVTVGNNADPADKGTWDFGGGAFTFTTIQVEAGGDFSTTKPFTATVRDVPFPSFDTEQNGHGVIIDNGRSYIIGANRSTWVEHTDINAGDSVLHLRQAPVNWRAGETVIVFDTRRGNNCAGGACTKGAQREVKTIQSVSGTDVVVTTPFQFAHTSAGSPYPSPDGTSKRIYPWATHIGGASIFRSANPSGVRGHMIAVAHADVWWQDFTVDQFGRTKMGGTTTTPGGANQIGRYPVHMHHNVGRGPQSNGRAFTLSGLEVNGSPRYCVVIHKSSWGLIEDNATYDCPAAHFYYEDGDEYENITRRNSAVFGIGTGGREDITAGFGFYCRSAWCSHLTDNRSANHFNSQGTEAAYGFKYFPKYLGTVKVSPGPGQMPSLNRDSYTQGQILQFENNLCFADDSCFTFWWINMLPPGQPMFPQEGTAPSVVKNLTFVRIPEKGIFQYEATRLTIDGLIGRDFYRGVAGQDYVWKYGTIRNVDFQTCDSGLEVSAHTYGTPFVLENAQLGCARNISTFLMWESGGYTFTGLSAETTRTYRNVTTLGGTKAYTWNTSTGNRNYTSKQLTFVENHQGSGANFQLFAPDANPTYMIPQHIPATCNTTVDSGSSCNRVGSPVAGETNAQNWASRKLAFMGQPLCANPQTSPDFDGFACGGTPPPPTGCTYSVQPASHASPNAGDTFAVTITASGGTNCAQWTATSSQPWVTFSQASGTGSATITATVAANTTTASRTAGLTVDAQSISVTQAAAQAPTCTVSAAPTSHSSPAGGNSFTVTVTASGTSCAWQASTGVSWLNVTPGSSTGGGSANVTVSPNTTTTSRTGTLTIAGDVVTVTQAGATAPPPSGPTGTPRMTPVFRVRCTSGTCVKAEFWVAADGGPPALMNTDTTMTNGEYAWSAWVSQPEPATYTIEAFVYDAAGVKSAAIPLPGKP